MYKSEKQTIFYVLGLYLSSTLLLIFTLFGSYYLYKLDEREHQEKRVLKEYALVLEEKLLEVHENSDTKYEYPRFKEFQSAIYDIDKNLIFSTLQKTPKDFKQEFFFQYGNVYFIAPLKPYYLGGAYAVIEKKQEPLNIIGDLLMVALLVVFIALMTSFFLVKLVLRPLRNTLHLLDNFIKETTHELNTPITTILANIETLEGAECDEKSMKKLQRIKTASMTISNLYQDLVYLLLNHQVASQNQTLNLSEIARQRVHYFSEMANAKKLTIDASLQEDILVFADKQKMERLIDNIISNAIKYTNRATTITITLTPSSLSVQDEGNGMSQEEIGSIFERYSRFDKTQGGFGIGYSIVKSIVDEYGMRIAIDSQPNKGTKVTLTW